MQAAPADLRRGRIFYALFPFAAEFPLTIEDEAGQKLVFPTIEDYARARKGRATRVVTDVRLRPVLLLHDGTRGEHEDVVCLRINTVKPRHRRSTTTWEQIEQQRHLFFYYLSASQRRYGLQEDSLIALTSIGSIQKSAILGLHVGELTHRELQSVSERLSRILSLDLAPLIAERASELLRRAGYAI